MRSARAPCSWPRPRHYPGIDVDDPDIYDSDEIYCLRTGPDDLVIFGGGPTGVKLATVFTALGVRATLVSAADRLLLDVDGGLVRVVLGSAADGAHRVDGWLRVTLSTGSVLAGDAVLVAARRTANAEGLGLAQAGVRVDAGRADPRRPVLPDDGSRPDRRRLHPVCGPHSRVASVWRGQAPHRPDWGLRGFESTEAWARVVSSRRIGQRPSQQRSDGGAT